MKEKLTALEIGIFIDLLKESGGMAYRDGMDLYDKLERIKHELEMK